MGVFLVGLLGCGNVPGPKSTDISSDSIPTLSDRITYLNEYVAFRRSYQALDFHIRFRNGGDGMIPSPSEWDIRIVAVVPPEELTKWIPLGVTATPTAERQWLESVPHADRAVGIREWYVSNNKVVGVDRESSVVAYRLWTR